MNKNEYQKHLEFLSEEIEDTVEWHIKVHGMNTYEYKMTEKLVALIDEHMDRLLKSREKES